MGNWRINSKTAAGWATFSKGLSQVSVLRRLRRLSERDCIRLALAPMQSGVGMVSASRKTRMSLACAAGESWAARQRAWDFPAQSGGQWEIVRISAFVHPAMMERRSGSVPSVQRSSAKTRWRLG